MIWISQIVFWIPLIFSVSALIFCFRQIILKKNLPPKALRNLTLAVVILYILQVLSRIYIFYWQLKKSAFGNYLLPGKGSSFFIDNVWTTFLEPFVIMAVTALVLILLIFLTRRFIKRPLFEDSDWIVLILTIFPVGFPNLIVLIFASFLLMIIFQIFQKLTFKKSFGDRLEIAPFLIFSSLAILVLTNFPFYHNFLNFVGLTNLY